MVYMANKLTKNDEKLLKEKYKQNYKKILKKIENHYPVQYLIGDVNFCGYKIYVNRGVLIPRFETEGLVEKTIKYLKKYHLEDTNVLDIGTGSGCISVALKRELPELSITALDISRSALKLASKNFKLHEIEASLIHTSIFKFNPINKYGLIICNPPYVSTNEYVGPETRFEPKEAIFARNDGLEFYNHIIKNSHKMLQRKSILAFEIGMNQAKYLKFYAKEYFPDAIIEIEKDLSNRDRYLFIINE